MLNYYHYGACTYRTICPLIEHSLKIANALTEVSRKTL